MKIKVTTAFDCTETGVTGHYRPGKLPIKLPGGETIQTSAGWAKARNQQRNWETLMQLMQLRSIITEVTAPRRDDIGLWSFEFQVDQDIVPALQEDCNNVPIITRLNEHTGCAAMIHTQGAEQNIWFQRIP